VPAKRPHFADRRIAPAKQICVPHSGLQSRGLLVGRKRELICFIVRYAARSKEKAAPVPFVKARAAIRQARNLSVVFGAHRTEVRDIGYVLPKPHRSQSYGGYEQREKNDEKAQQPASLADELAAERDGCARQNQPRNAQRQAGVKREGKVVHEMRQRDDCNEEAQPDNQKPPQQSGSARCFHAALLCITK
jgi:hypothetical protein